MTSHNKADLVHLAMSRQLDILAANNPVGNHKHRMAMGLVHSLTDIDLRKSRLLCPLALSRSAHMHLAMSPLPGAEPAGSELESQPRSTEQTTYFINRRGV